MTRSAIYSEIKRIDAVFAAESRRVDGLLEAQVTAVNAALAAAEKAVAAALAASEKAVNKAETAQGNVNENQNEFRGQLRDQAALFMPRTETENLIRELRDLIAANASIRSEAVDDLRTGLGDLRSRLDVGPPSLSTLQTRSDESIGARRGAVENRTAIFAAIAVLGSIVVAAVAVIGLVLK